ncbi:MAG: elongation factor P [Candidatus Melainabacteria bacterium RIFCSPHIGHO2_02_FULL_34_12]|nr:MAG: elongation factor P [Candidatus Melainabacteria bacterium RIFCSPHIGHO2_02_FULL_34_12]
MISVNDFRTGQTIVWNNGIWTVLEFLHVKPGKGAAFVRAKLKNLEKGSVIETTFRGGEKIPSANVEKREMQYLYKSGDRITFMDNQTYEQLEVGEEQVGEQVKYLKEQTNVMVLFYNEKIIGIDIPAHVELKVTDTPPGYKGDTAAGNNKPATLETGAQVSVPFFVNIGDVVRIDTRNNQYIDRVKA